MMRFALLGMATLSFLSCAGAGLAADDRLTIMMFTQVPLLDFASGRATGHVGSRAQKILDASGLAYSLSIIPPKRILMKLEFGPANSCSFAFFKTPEREKFAHYSQPFFGRSATRVVGEKS